MLTSKNVYEAMELLLKPIGYLSASAESKAIARSLEVYEDRGEFDGTFDSAINCLSMAGYEIAEN